MKASLSLCLLYFTYSEAWTQPSSKLFCARETTSSTQLHESSPRRPGTRSVEAEYARRRVLGQVVGGVAAAAVGAVGFVFMKESVVPEYRPDVSLPLESVVKSTLGVKSEPAAAKKVAPSPAPVTKKVAPAPAPAAVVSTAPVPAPAPVFGRSTMYRDGFDPRTSLKSLAEATRKLDQIPGMVQTGDFASVKQILIQVTDETVGNTNGLMAATSEEELRIKLNALSKQIRLDLLAVDVQLRTEFAENIIAAVFQTREDLLNFQAAATPMEDMSKFAVSGSAAAPGRQPAIYQYLPPNSPTSF